MPFAPVADVVAPKPAELAQTQMQRPGGGWLLRARAGVVPYLYLAPALLLLVMWTYLPLARALELSAYSWNLLPTAPATWVGAGNYQRLFSLPTFWESIGLTIVLIVGLLPFAVVLPIVLGLAGRVVSKRARTIYHAIAFLPFLAAPVATAAVWRWLLNPQTGLVDTVLGTNQNWIYDTATAQSAIIVITGWQLLGYAVLVVWAGLSGINPHYDEAARVDGASGGQIQNRITLPLLSPTVTFLILTTVLLGPNLAFPLIDTLTQGGPARATTNFTYLLYDYAFRNFDAGLSAAAGMVLFVTAGVVALGLVWVMEKVAFHDD